MRIHQGYFVVKKKVLDVSIRAFCYTKLFLEKKLTKYLNYIRSLIINELSYIITYLIDL